MRRRPLPVWKPSDDQMRCWPAVSGNSINGVGEQVRRRPSPIYRHPPEKIPHGPLQKWFYERTGNADETLAEARRDRQRAIDEPLVPIAEQSSERPAGGRWSQRLRSRRFLRQLPRLIGRMPPDAPLVRGERRGMSISTSSCRTSMRRRAARSASPSAHSAGPGVGSNLVGKLARRTRGGDRE